MLFHEGWIPLWSFAGGACRFCRSNGEKPAVPGTGGPIGFYALSAHRQDGGTFEFCGQKGYVNIYGKNQALRYFRRCVQRA